jgi:hypothetical protein
MTPELIDILIRSTFACLPGSYIYAKAASLPNTDGHFLVAQDADEITVVTRSERVAELDLIEVNRDNYALIALNVAVPFYSVGFLATISNALAAAGLDILIVSTYSRDYLLVRVDTVEIAAAVLTELGLTSQ